MAKAFIEKVPQLPAVQGSGYANKYRDVDAQGRYLYWEEFKWRVEEGDDALLAWNSVKNARNFGRKYLKFTDKKTDFFSYSISDALQEKLYDIMEFSRVGLVPSDAVGNQFLVSSLSIEEAINSSQLEGASTTRRVAQEMLKAQRKPKDEDEQMIYNNYLLMKTLKNDKNEMLSIDMILRFHKIATDNTHHNKVVPGQFRTDNDIYIADRDDNVLFQPPNVDEVVPRMKQLCAFANDAHKGSDFMHPVIKAIILHYMIGYIHPFSDGNGRTARALFYWFMLKSGYDYFEYISISKFLKEAPVKYTKSYQYVEADENDLNYFIFYQIEIIMRAIEDLRKYLDIKSKAYEEIDSLLKETSFEKLLNFIQKDIIKTSIKRPGKIFTANEVAIEYDIAINTARSYLQKLVEYEILSPYKKGRIKAYIAPENLGDVLKGK